MTSVNINNLSKKLLLDVFAMQAMSSLDAPEEYLGTKETDDSYFQYARMAYKIAAAMMKERDNI